MLVSILPVDTGVTLKDGTGTGCRCGQLASPAQVTQASKGAYVTI